MGQAGQIMEQASHQNLAWGRVPTLPLGASPPALAPNMLVDPGAQLLASPQTGYGQPAHFRGQMVPYSGQAEFRTTSPSRNMSPRAASSQAFFPTQMGQQYGIGRPPQVAFAASMHNDTTPRQSPTVGPSLPNEFLEA